MTSQVLANPRRTSLAGLIASSRLDRCAGADGDGCRNVAVRKVETPQGRRSLCRRCSEV